MANPLTITVSFKLHEKELYDRLNDKKIIRNKSDFIKDAIEFYLKYQDKEFKAIKKDTKENSKDITNKKKNLLDF